MSNFLKWLVSYIIPIKIQQGYSLSIDTQTNFKRKPQAHSLSKISAKYILNNEAGEFEYVQFLKKENSDRVFHQLRHTESGEYFEVDPYFFNVIFKIKPCVKGCLHENR